ncbi:MAG: hypothetical protein QOH57_518 [Mycobacterium sp.]|jgi:hypothetical protein|nr:hypothetical protein [Mycobacterium sp.]
MTTTRSALVCTALLVAGSWLTAAPAQADEGLPLHHVKYTMTARKPIYAQIYYLDHEPAIWADYGHNPYEFTPNIAADLGPNQPPWTFELDLAKPQEWAMVIANTGGEPGTPMFHCEISVDGATVVSKDGGPTDKGVLCSIRGW